MLRISLSTILRKSTAASNSAFDLIAVSPRPKMNAKTSAGKTSIAGGNTISGTTGSSEAS